MGRPGMLIASVIAVGLIGLGIFQFMPASEGPDPAASDAGGNGDSPGASTSLQAPPAGSVSVTAEAVHRGMEPSDAGALIGLFRRIREGAMAEVTDAVERVTGRPAIDLAAFANHHAEALCRQL